LGRGKYPGAQVIKSIHIYVVKVKQMVQLSQSISSRDHAQTQNFNLINIDLNFIAAALLFCLPVKRGMFHRQTNLGAVAKKSKEISNVEILSLSKNLAESLCESQAWWLMCNLLCHIDHCMYTCVI